MTKKLIIPDIDDYLDNDAGTDRGVKQSTVMKGRLVGEANPMYGKSTWNKGLDKTDPRVLKYSQKTEGKSHPGNQFGKGNLGKTQDEEWKRKRLDKIKGPHALSTCPHCNKEGGERSMKRWHFDNCKAK